MLLIVVSPPTPQGDAVASVAAPFGSFCRVKSSSDGCCFYECCCSACSTPALRRWLMDPEVHPLGSVVGGKARAEKS